MTAPWTLHLGDCLPFLRSLPDKSVDHVITDPPYTEFTHGKNRGNELGGTHPLEAITFRSLTDDLRSACASEFARVSRRWVCVWCDAEGLRPWVDDLTSAGLEHVRAGFWVKDGAAPQFSGDKPGTGAEVVSIAHQTRDGQPIRKRWNGGGRVAVWVASVVNSGRETRHHETQKPLALMEALVRDFTDPGETILDPFAGSGTTGVAAVRLGRRFIGCELSPKYHAVATKRLSQAREQLGLWTGAA